MRDVERVKPTAEFIGISEWKLRDMANKKLIPHFRAGRILLFRKKSIEEWMEQQEAAAMKQEVNNRLQHLVVR